MHGCGIDEKVYSFILITYCFRISGVPKILPCGTPKPDGATHNRSHRSGSGLRPGLDGSQAVPPHPGEQRAECYGPPVRSAGIITTSHLADAFIQPNIQAVFELGTF